MNTIKVRNIEIGSGTPKIIVPIVGVTKQEIIDEAKTFDSIPVDMVEWRVDWFEGVFDFEKVEVVLKELRAVLGETPILMTFRTSKEGGEKSIEPEDYAKLNIKAAQTGYVDFIDVEIFTGDAIVTKIIDGAHAAGVKVIASNHDFHKTPEKSDIIYRLRKMQDMNADIPKIAVMPQNKKDVLTLLSATEEMTSLYADRPIITMSMAGTGVISRLCGEVFGSSMTFGAAKKASAPGQMGVKELETVLGLLHSAMLYLAYPVIRLLFTLTCPVTEFAVASHLNTANSSCHHAILRHFRFQKCLYYTFSHLFFYSRKSLCLRVRRDSPRGTQDLLPPSQVYYCYQAAHPVSNVPA